MNVPIIGGAGFIGATITRPMSEQGTDPIRVLDHFCKGDARNLEVLRMDFTEQSIPDFCTIERVADGLHFVAPLPLMLSVPRLTANPRAFREANTTDIPNVLEAPRTNRGDDLAVAASSAIYGLNGKLLKHEAVWTRMLGRCGVSKHTAEGYVRTHRAFPRLQYTKLPNRSKGSRER